MTLRKTDVAGSSLRGRSINPPGRRDFPARNENTGFAGKTGQIRRKTVPEKGLVNQVNLRI
jgi:hypothetical protein